MSRRSSFSSRTLVNSPVVSSPALVPGPGSLMIVTPREAESRPASALAPAEAKGKAKANPFAGKSMTFWLVFVALFVTGFLAAVDFTAVSTVLPTMAADLDAADSSWIGTAYALGSTALIPWTAGLAAIFGRRATMVASLILFILGSALTGGSQSLAQAVAGRVIQGLGGGGILIMTNIIIIDLVPLVDRGAYFGLVAAVWAIGSGVGPPLGGALGQSGEWRWLFWLNIPTAAVAVVLVWFFFRVKAPKTSWTEKMAQMDYANLIFVGATTAAVAGLSRGGVDAPWASAGVLVPLLLGLAGMVLFVWVEKRFITHPTVPFDILVHQTSISGYLGTFLHGIVSIAILFFMPVYFQATKDASVLKSGVDLLSLSFTVGPAAIACGLSIGLTGHYPVQNYLGWVVSVVGFGLLSMLKADSSTATWVGLACFAGLGLGSLYCSTNIESLPVLAPLRPDQQPHATAFFSFVHAFGQVLGITIGSAVLSNELERRLPVAFAGGDGRAAAAAVPLIRGLAEPLKGEVRVAFAEGLRVVWLVMLGISGLGLASVGLMRSLSLTSETDEKWGLEEGARKEGRGRV